MWCLSGVMANAWWSRKSCQTFWHPSFHWPSQPTTGFSKFVPYSLEKSFGKNSNSSIVCPNQCHLTGKVPRDGSRLLTEKGTMSRRTTFWNSPQLPLPLPFENSWLESLLQRSGQWWNGRTSELLVPSAHPNSIGRTWDGLRTQSYFKIGYTPDCVVAFNLM